MTVTPLDIGCRRIDEFDRGSWDSIREAFSTSEEHWLSQAWFTKMEENFEPGAVKMGWSPGTIWMYARFTDRDIFNTADQHNQQTWNMGDVFEVFLRPLPGERYFEFHVTPENQWLQLRFPNAKAVFRPHNEQVDWRDFLMHDKIISSQTLVTSEDSLWETLLELPVELIESDAWRVGQQFLFSCSRYDYTRGAEMPVLSSTSPHVKANFHRQEEWGTLTLRS